MQLENCQFEDHKDSTWILLASLLLLLALTGGPAGAQSDPSILADVLGPEPEYWAPFCADTRSDGSPATPARPTWSSLEGRHWDGRGDRLPSYRELSKNFSLEQSLQFLISTVTNLIDVIDKAEDRVDKVDIAGGDFGIPDVGIVPQAQGHCLCVTKTFGGNETCSVSTLTDSVGATLEKPFQGEKLADIAVNFTSEQLKATLADLEELLDELDTYAAPDGELDQALTDGLAAELADELRTAISHLDPRPAGCDPARITGAVDSAAEEVAEELRLSFQADIQSLRIVLLAARDGIPELISFSESVVELLTRGSGVKPKEVYSQLENLLAEYDRIVKENRAAVDELDKLWTADKYGNLADTFYQRLVERLEEAPETQACISAIQADGFEPGYDLGQFRRSLEDAFTTLVEDGWDEAKNEALGAMALIDSRLAGTATVFGVAFVSQAFEALDERFTEEMKECYQHATRPECFELCEAEGQKDFLWLPVDFQQDPEKMKAAAVASAGLFALDQLGWLDQVRAWVSSQQALDDVSGDLGKALQGAGEVARSVKKALEKIQEVLGKGFEYVDRFGEGYHLGGYSHLRPELHLCVPYAGHGAFAQMASLGGGSFSLGACYTSHQLSEKHRAQFRSGGFAVSAFGRELSLAPAIELSAQIDGLGGWNPRSPFGLPINASGWSEEKLEKLDVLNVMPEDEGLHSPLIRDLFPVRRTMSLDSGILWPRPDVDMPWEGESSAVISFGLNLDFDFGPEDYTLPEIDIIPRVLVVIPKYGYSAGIEWTHETNLLRDRLLERLNENLATPFHLSDELFDRDMHALQAPDLTADNRTSVYLEPYLGIDAFLGFNLWKLRIGAGAGITVAVGLEPGGQGGVIDLGRPLADALTASNPPTDAPCEPEWQLEVVKTCSNKKLDGANADLACGPADDRGSCLVESSGGDTPGPLCLDGWIGIDEELCDNIEKWAGEMPDWVTGELGSSRAADLLEQIVETAENVETAWSEDACAEREGGDSGITTAVLDFAGISECVNHGTCTFGDGSVFHDLKLADCEQGIPDYIAVAVGGENRACALRADGIVFCWGDWPGGPPPGDFTQIAVGDTHGCALDQDGKAVCWGEDEDGRASPPGGSFTALAAGETFTCGLEASGGVTCWGEPEDLGLDGELVQLTAGPDHVCGLRENGSWLCSNGLEGESCDNPCASIQALNHGVLVSRSSSGDQHVYDKLTECPQGGGSGVFLGLRHLLDGNVPFGDCGLCGLEEDGRRVRCWDTKAKPSSFTPSSPVVQLAGSVYGEKVCGLLASGDVDCLGQDPPAPGSIGIASHYTCESSLEESVASWSGDGCHPLQTGFPSACACNDDEHCATGESCNGDEGVCEANERAVSCLADDGGGCPLGRRNTGGACAAECQDAEDCVGELECQDGVCIPPHGLPFAESVAWQTAHGDAPRHLIGTYALADFKATLLLKASLYVEASFKLFGKPRTWRLLDLNKAFDLGSTWKGRFQPGLEALYEHECEAPALGALPVTNRWPRARTSFPFSGVFNAPGVLAPRHCPTGGVCRYPESAASLPLFEDPADVPTGNAGDVASLLAWCQEDLPRNAEKGLVPSENDDLVDGIVDTAAWGEATLMELWRQKPLCVDGRPWEEWLADLEPAAERPSSLQDASCVYDDPGTGRTHTFACADTTAELLRLWGCLDTRRSQAARWLARRFPDTVAAGGDVFELEKIFRPRPVDDPVYGPGDYFDLTLDTMRPEIRRASPLLTERWLRTVDACFSARYESPAETACECSIDADCDVELDERCDDGRCQRPLVLDSGGECLQPDCAPRWVQSSCPHVELAADIGPCCGDGVVQRGERYSEECDPALDAECSATCRAEPSTGACCTATGCQETVPQTSCGGSWHPGQSCSDLAGCDATARGACCRRDGCGDGVTAAECDGGGFFPAATCAELDYCRPAPPGCARQPAGLVAWWPFEPVQGDVADRDLTFERLRGFTGRLHGATHSAAMVGHGLELASRGDRAELDHASVTDVGTGDFSLAFWIRSAPGRGVRTVLDNRRRDGGHRGFSVFLYNDRLGLQLADGRHTNMLGPVGAGDGTWHHVGITVDRDRPDGVRFYLDGRSAGPTRDPRSRDGSLSTGRPLRVGANAFDGAFPWTGSIDELHFFDRPLAPAEIYPLAAAGDLGTCACPDPLAPDVDYVGRDPVVCSILRFACEPGQWPFSDSCGCGCRGEPACPPGSKKARAKSLHYPDRDCVAARDDVESEASLTGFHYRRACQETHGGALPDTVLGTHLASCRPEGEGSWVDVDVCCP